MTKITDTLVSTNYRTLKAASVTKPWQGRDELLCTRLNNFQADLDTLQKGVVTADSICHLVAFEFDVTVGNAATNLIFDEDAPFKFEIVDVIVQARATSGAGTMTITDGSTAITDAIACANDGVKTRATTIDDATSTIDVDGSLKCVGSAAGVKCLVTVIAIAR